MMQNLTGVKALSLMPSLPMKKETLSFSKVYFDNTYFIILHHFRNVLTWPFQVKFFFSAFLILIFQIQVTIYGKVSRDQLRSQAAYSKNWMTIITWVMLMQPSACTIKMMPMFMTTSTFFWYFLWVTSSTSIAVSRLFLYRKYLYQNNLKSTLFFSLHS